MVSGGTINEFLLACSFGFIVTLHTALWILVRRVWWVSAALYICQMWVKLKLICVLYLSINVTEFQWNSFANFHSSSLKGQGTMLRWVLLALLIGLCASAGEQKAKKKVKSQSLSRGGQISFFQYAQLQLMSKEPLHKIIYSCQT